jgi:NADH:ubiquinone oxidoreductase subunit F (NADH-binding)
MSGLALLAGPGVQRGAETYAEHTTRLGALPRGGASLIDALERAGLRGRGGAAFPVAAKWRSVASHRGPRVVLVNGAEGEPLSRKDRVLMETRAHLVLDGAVLAARTIGASRIVHYIGGAHLGALATMRRAVAERPDAERRMMQVVSAPSQYISGEETAAVHCVNDGIALPTALPPRPYERGVDGRPTLVQNVETLAHAALIARSGRPTGTALVTVSGAVPATSVQEVALSAAVADAVTLAGGLTSDSDAVLLGGYFGSWVPAREAWSLPLDPPALRARGMSLGCGVIGVLPSTSCGVMTSWRIASYLAAESARQCGPCTFGLRAIAAAMTRLATMSADPDDLRRVQRWAGLLPGRGACKHPDGAAIMIASALRVFENEYALHAHERRCSVSAMQAEAA